MVKNPSSSNEEIFEEINSRIIMVINFEKPLKIYQSSKTKAIVLQKKNSLVTIPNHWRHNLQKHQSCYPKETSNPSRDIHQRFSNEAYRKSNNTLQPRIENKKQNFAARRGFHQKLGNCPVIWNIPSYFLGIFRLVIIISSYVWFKRKLQVPQEKSPTASLKTTLCPCCFLLRREELCR